MSAFHLLLGLILLLALLTPALAAPAITPGLIGCDSYSVRDYIGSGKMTLETFPAFCAENGIKGVCFNDFFFKSWDEAYLRKLKAAVAKSGCVMTGIIRDGDLAGLQGEARQKALEECKMKLRAAAFLGAPAMRVNVGSAGDAAANATVGVERVVGFFNELLPLARELNVKLTIENHGGVSANAENILAIIKATDPDWVGSCLDFGNWPDDLRYESCRKLAPFAYMTHAKFREFNAQGEDAVIDGSRILAMLRRVGYRGAVSIEFEGSGDQIVGVQKSVALIKRYWPAGSNLDTWQDILPAGAKVAKVAGGLQFAEGPVWTGRELLFTDIPANEIKQLAGGKVGTFTGDSKGANGLAVTTDSVLACRHDAQDLAAFGTAVEKMRTLQVLAAGFEGKPFNSPNDLVLGPDGSVFFTDPTYGLNGRPQPQPVQGVYCLAPDKSISLVTGEMVMPNGIALGPGAFTLYVADSERRRIRAYHLDDGKWGDGYDFASTGKDVPDGMAVDARGNLYVAAGKAVVVFDPAGYRLGSIAVPEVASNCTFGGADRRTLYITARTSVYAIHLGIPGLAW